MFDIHDFAAITEFGKSDRQAIATGATGAANAVYVVFLLHGQTEIEHMADAGHINAARSHVSCDQNLHSSITQSL